MEKLYNDYQYAEKAVEANTNGQKLYIHTFTREVDVEVLDFITEEQEVQVPVLDENGEPVLDENGEPTYTTEIQEVQVPVMVDKEVTELVPVYDENGDPVLDEHGEQVMEEQIKIIQVQSSHIEQVEKEFAELVVAENLYYICYEDNYTDGTINPNYEEEKAIAKRVALDNLTLTPADVERALYKAKGMDFDDLKTLIQAQAPQIDIKAISIELRANLFYRGAKLANGIRLIDTVGALLGYTSEDMDYLFLNKELPVKEQPEPEPEENEEEQDGE